MLDLTLDILATLVAHDTANPPRRITTGGIVAAAAGCLRDGGFDVDVRDLGDGCVTVLAVRGAPTGVLNVHLDTVPASEGWTGDPLALRRAGDRAIGLGACDVKGAAACLLAAALETRGAAAILLTTDEEAGSSRCVRAFLDERPSFVERAVVAEPTRCRAVTAHRGLYAHEGVFRGAAAHGSSVGARSAVHDAGLWIAAALERAESEAEAGANGLRGVRLNVGVVEGGVKANVVAPSARVVFGVRPRPEQDGPVLVEALCALAPDGADVRWTARFAGPPLPPDPRAAALAETLELPPGPPVDFWTEAALFAAAGVPAIVYGPGDIAQAHAPDEWVALAELDRAARRYAALLEAGF